MSPLSLDRSLFHPRRIGENLHLEPAKNSTSPTLFVLSENNENNLPEIVDAISQIGEILGSERIESREDVISRFHLIERIDLLQTQVLIANLSGATLKLPQLCLKELFPLIPFWKELGKSTVIGREYLYLSERRQKEFLQLLKINPQKPLKAKTPLDLVLAKKANFESLTIPEQIETLIEFYEETDDKEVKTALEQVFRDYSTTQVLTALHLHDFPEENWKTGPYPPICANFSVWAPLFSEKHWREIPKSIFFLLISQIENFSASLPVETFRSLYRKHDPKLEQLCSVAKATKRLFFLPSLLQSDTPEHQTETRTFIRNATPAWIAPFFSDRHTPRIITAYIAAFLSQDQIENLRPDLFKNGANALAKAKQLFGKSDDETKAFWVAHLFAKTISNDPSCLNSFYTLLKSITPPSEQPPFLSISTPQILWKLLWISSKDTEISSQICRWIPEQKWAELLTTPYVNVAIHLFEEGALLSTRSITPFLNFFREQQALEPFQLDCLIRGADRYPDALINQFKTDCEQKLEALFLENLPDTPTRESEKFFFENVSTLSKKSLFELANRKKEALIAHIETLKTPKLKILLLLLDFNESDPIDTELIGVIGEKDSRLLSLWSEMNESPGNRVSVEAFNNYGKKQE